MILGSLIALLFALFFFEPAYYRLRSKGWPPRAFIRLAILACLLGWVLISFVWLGLILFWLAPVLLLAVAHGLPYRREAPGAAYLQIACSCPHCAQTVFFARRMEGFAALCPACNEILTVPGTPVGSAVGGVLAFTRRPDASAPVPVYGALRPDWVEGARQRLEAESIPVFVTNLNAVYMYPGLGFLGGGARVLVPAEYADEAQQVLTVAPTEIPWDADTGTDWPAAADQDGTALMLFKVFMLICMVVPIVMYLWAWIVPSCFPLAVAEGRLPAKLEWKQLMCFVVVWGLFHIARHQPGGRK